MGCMCSRHSVEGPDTAEPRHQALAGAMATAGGGGAQPANTAKSSESGATAAAVVLTPLQVLELADEVATESFPGELDALTLAAVALVESAGDAMACRPNDDVGEPNVGLCQLHLSTARWLNSMRGFSRCGTPTRSSLEDPRVCLYFCGAYLHVLAEAQQAQQVQVPLATEAAAHGADAPGTPRATLSATGQLSTPTMAAAGGAGSASAGGLLCAAEVSESPGGLCSLQGTPGSVLRGGGHSSHASPLSGPPSPAVPEPRRPCPTAARCDIDDVAEHRAAAGLPVLSSGTGAEPTVWPGAGCASIATGTAADSHSCVVPAPGASGGSGCAAGLSLGCCTGVPAVAAGARAAGDERPWCWCLSVTATASGDLSAAQQQQQLQQQQLQQLQVQQLQLQQRQHCSPASASDVSLDWLLPPFQHLLARQAPEQQHGLPAADTEGTAAGLATAHTAGDELSCWTGGRAGPSGATGGTADYSAAAAAALVHDDLDNAVVAAASMVATASGQPCQEVDLEQVVIRSFHAGPKSWHSASGATYWAKYQHAKSQLAKLQAALEAGRALAGPTSDMVMHVVQPGETLAKIAAAIGATQAQVLQANPELPDGSCLQQNDCIALPIPYLVPRLHAARVGETAAAIARAHGCSLNRLVARNPELRDSRAPSPGWVVLLPGLRGESTPWDSAPVPPVPAWHGLRILVPVPVAVAPASASTSTSHGAAALDTTGNFGFHGAAAAQDTTSPGSALSRVPNWMLSGEGMSAAAAAAASSQAGSGQAGLRSARSAPTPEQLAMRQQFPPPLPLPFQRSVPLPAGNSGAAPPFRSWGPALPQFSPSEEGGCCGPCRH